jgi:hypothetical protein
MGVTHPKVDEVLRERYGVRTAEDLELLMVEFTHAIECGYMSRAEADANRENRLRVLALTGNSLE